MTLLCLLFGHKWTRKVITDYIKHGDLWERTNILQLPCCMRCGKRNPLSE